MAAIPPRPRQPIVGRLLVVGAIGYSFGAAATTPFTVPADVMTAVPIAVLAVAVVWRWPWRPVIRRPSAPVAARHPYRAWVLLAAAIVAWELVAYAARGSRAAHPTFSSMADAVDRFYLLKAALFFGWLCLGALVVNLGRPRPSETAAP